MSTTATPVQRLTAACAAGDVETISALLAEHVNVNDKAAQDQRPLHSAAMASLDAVQLLVGQGADINAKDVAGDTALHFASKSQMAAQIVPYLLEQGATLEAKNKAKQTPLLKAVAEGNGDAVEALILAGASAEGAVIEAVRSGAFHVGVMAALMEHAGGADALNAVDAKTKEPALHFLAGAWGTDAEDREIPEGYVFGLDACTFFLDNGADLEIENKATDNVIHCLASKDGPQLAAAMQFFAERGANLEAKNKKKLTPLLAAASKCRAEAIIALVGAGVRLNVKDPKGQTALIHLAKSKKRSSVAALEALVAAGADSSIAPVDDMTPLQLTAKDGNVEKVRLLLAHGADPNLMHGSQHAIHIAAKKKKTEVIEMLVDAGADLNEKDDVGKTPLFYAADNDDAVAVKALIKGGANIGVRCNGEVALDRASGQCERLIRARIR